MSRSEILHQERERIMKQLSMSPVNRAKLLATLMDIDDEMDEMEELRQAKNQLKRA